MRIKLCVILFLCLTECSQRGTDFADNSSRQIRVGITTKGEVEQTLGAPFNRTIKGHEETWVYSHTMVATNPGFLALSMIPVIGSGVAGYSGQAMATQDSKEMVIVFRNGVVSNCKMQTTSSNAGGGTTIKEDACGK